MARLKEHSHIEVDTAGHGQYLRLTCTICGGTLLEEPYHTQADWHIMYEHYIKEHSNIHVCMGRREEEYARMREQKRLL